jgi:amino acid adenylation domain-containing protein
MPNPSPYERLNATGRSYDLERSVVSLIAESSARHPDREAVLCGDRRLTYGELERLSNRLARRLLRAADCGPETLLGLCLERSEWLLISILAIFKTGSGYVPLDPGYPAERLGYILADSGVAAVLTEESLAPLFAGRRLVHLEGLREDLAAEEPSAPPRRHDPRHLAYVMYTSGTTGPPKGVMIQHRGLTNVLLWSVEELGGSPWSVVFAGSSECFDLSVFELLFPLVAGRSVRILSNLTIPLYLKRHEGVLINTVPSLVRTIAKRPEVLQGATALNLVGEELPPALLRELRQAGEVEIRNIYGTTETTIHSINQKLGAAEDEVPIGRPIANTRAWVLDERLELAPPGGKGEILLGGAGLARGYLGRPDLTAERFVPDPYGDGERLYRTGDLGSLRPDGRLACHGRIDDQIKVKGFRIEPGEVSSYLDRHPKVRASVILAKPEEGGAKTMVAFVRSDHDDVTAGELRSFLKSKLPPYMVPGRFVILRELPVTSTGKVDRAALLDRA